MEKGPQWPKNCGALAATSPDWVVKEHSVAFEVSPQESPLSSRPCPGFAVRRTTSSHFSFFWGVTVAPILLGDENQEVRLSL